MTRHRVYGSDTEFCAWMRKQKDLPSSGPDFGFSASDNDVTVHRYKTIVDGIGTREVQALMQIEVKTRQGKPSMAQIDTLGKLNLFGGRQNTSEGVVFFYGVFFLVLSGTDPDNSRKMWWGWIPKGERISDASRLKFEVISKNRLIELLRFERHPRTMEKPMFRRHHKTSEITETLVAPLGFEYDRVILRRS